MPCVLVKLHFGPCKTDLTDRPHYVCWFLLKYETENAGWRYSDICLQADNYQILTGQSSISIKLEDDPLRGNKHILISRGGGGGTNACL